MVAQFTYGSMSMVAQFTYGSMSVVAQFTYGTDAELIIDGIYEVELVFVIGV